MSKPPTAFALRHVAFEDAGLLAPLLAERGVGLRYGEAVSVDWRALDPLADDLWIVLGGPIGVYETAAYPFLEPETAAIRARLDADRPMLGLCLGAQLMARALGAEVSAGTQKEIGYAPVRLTRDGAASPLAALNAAGDHVLHWHGDQMALPPGCTLLAENDITPVQAFARGPRQLALQFHMETPPEALEAWLVGHAVEIAGAPGVSPQGLRAQAAAHGAAVAQAGRAAFARWLDGALDV